MNTYEKIKALSDELSKSEDPDERLAGRSICMVATAYKSGDIAILSVDMVLFGLKMCEKLAREADEIKAKSN